MKNRICLIFFFFVSTACFSQSGIFSDTCRFTNKLLPGFDSKQLNGSDFNWTQTKGQIVLLNFWSLTCSACFKEIPDFNKLAKEFKSQNVIVVSVIDDPRERASQRLSVNGEFYKLKRSSFNNDEVNYIVIPDGRNIMKKYFTQISFPKTFIVDKDGVLKYFADGYTEVYTDNGYVENGNYKNFKAMLASLVKKP